MIKCNEHLWCGFFSWTHASISRRFCKENYKMQLKIRWIDANYTFISLDRSWMITFMLLLLFTVKWIQWNISWPVIIKSTRGDFTTIINGGCVMVVYWSLFDYKFTISSNFCLVCPPICICIFFRFSIVSRTFSQFWRIYYISAVESIYTIWLIMDIVYLCAAMYLYRLLRTYMFLPSYNALYINNQEFNWLCV